ncbi:MAG: hypothetical protein K2K25_11625 [Muribaculaceae bacterium]|nr:hypothetical protein [Muribaculaceae bacterium]
MGLGFESQPDHHPKAGILNGFLPFVINLLNAGTDIKTVSSLLGLASIKMTEKYLYVIDSRKQEVINKLGRITFDIEDN